MWLFLVFVGIPLLEIGLFIQVGGVIGLWPTLLIVLATAFLGAWLVREQGTREMANIKRSFNELRNPAEPLAHGAMILVAGTLLVTPGFFTDFVGFSLLVPPVRRAAFNWIKSRTTVAEFEASRREYHYHSERAGVVTDIDYEDVTADNDRNPPNSNGNSGWTKH